MINILGVANKRIDNFTRDKYIQKVSYLDIRGQGQHAYKLTDKGKRLCSDKLSVDYFYQSGSASHDLQLASTYFQLSKEQQDNWLTEPEWRAKFKAKLEDLKSYDPLEYSRLSEAFYTHKLSPPDGGYEMNGHLVAVEVITASYRKADIQAKQDFCTVFNAEYKQY